MRVDLATRHLALMLRHLDLTLDAPSVWQEAHWWPEAFGVGSFVFWSIATFTKWSSAGARMHVQFQACMLDLVGCCAGMLA